MAPVQAQYPQQAGGGGGATVSGAAVLQPGPAAVPQLGGVGGSWLSRQVHKRTTAGFAALGRRIVRRPAMAVALPLVLVLGLAAGLADGGTARLATHRS